MLWICAGVFIACIVIEVIAGVIHTGKTNNIDLFINWLFGSEVIGGIAVLVVLYFAIGK